MSGYREVAPSAPPGVAGAPAGSGGGGAGPVRYSAVPADELTAEYEDEDDGLETSVVGGSTRDGWLLETNGLLAPATARAARGGGGRSHFCLLFCLALAVVGALFLGVIASLLFRNYPYLGMPQDPPPGSAPAAAQAWATLAAALTWGAVAVSLAVYYLCICRRRADKAD